MMSDPGIVSTASKIAAWLNPFPEIASFLVSKSPNPDISGVSRDVRSAKNRVDDAKSTYTAA